MAILTPVSLDDARDFLAEYDLAGDGGPRRARHDEPRAVVGIPAGTVNSSFAVELATERWFLRVYEEQDRAGAAREAELLTHLAVRGVKTPGPMRRQDGGFVGTIHGKPAALFPWREGGMRCFASVTASDAKKVGEALAEMHVAGRDAPRGAGRFERGDLLARLDRIAQAPDAMLAREAGPLRAKLDAWSAARDATLPRGLVHGDLFRDNVLWGAHGEITALLDFESASDGVLAYDLMVTILAWCFGDALDASRARAIVAGYAAVRPLTPAEARGLLAEACVAAIRFTVTRITDEAMRAHEAGRPPRADKDWRRFAARLSMLESLGDAGLRGALGV